MSEEDKIENVIGKFGKYQTWILILLTLGRFPAEFQLTNVVFILPSVSYICLDDAALNSSNYCPCENPVYDTSTIVSSVTTEWNLICDRSSLASLTQSMTQVGILIGSLFYGYISDRYGRKFAVLLALTTEAVFVTISGLVPELWMFMTSRFLIGTALGGTMLCCFVLLIELSGKSFIHYAVGLNEVSYVASYFILSVIAYYVREWRHLQLVTSVPWLIVFIYYWLLPESPRWLITVGKHKEAVELISKIALRNNRSADNVEAIVSEIMKESMSENQIRLGTYMDLFKTPKIRMNTLKSAIIWICCAHTFFGVNQYIGRLQGNIYLNVMLSALALAPGIVVVIIATLKFSRRISVITSFLVATISLLVFIVVPSSNKTASLIFAIIGQLGAYIAFVQIYLYVTEIFPTSIRNSAMGFASTFARFGGFVAPFVVDIGIEWVSISIFSALSLCAAFVCFLLPETKGKVLLNTIEQTEKKVSSIS